MWTSVHESEIRDICIKNLKPVVGGFLSIKCDRTKAIQWLWMYCISKCPTCRCKPIKPFQTYRLAFFFFYVLCKSWGEITQAQSPPFVTDGKPFQRDYDALDLLSFSFLLKPRYQLSVSRALDCLDRGAHVSPRPSPETGWNSPLWPLCLCHSQLSGNTMTGWWHFKCNLIAPCWVLLPLSPPNPRRGFIVCHIHNCPLKMGLTLEHIVLRGNWWTALLQGMLLTFLLRYYWWKKVVQA